MSRILSAVFALLCFATSARASLDDLTPQQEQTLRTLADLTPEQVFMVQVLTASTSFGVGYTIEFNGVNVAIRNGSGQSELYGNGRGNLILGYNEEEGQARARSGSHNLVIGRGHSYTRYGGIVAGLINRCHGDYCFVLGYENTAYDYSTILNGAGNVAGVPGGGTSNFATIVNGLRNKSSGYLSAILGGEDNTATGIAASVGGGANNLASAEASYVAGGALNSATGLASVVEGGAQNTASGYWSIVGGGLGVSNAVTFGWRAGSSGPTISGAFASP